MDISFELYRIFYHAACEKSISGAAKKLFISQPAVSQAIRQLEEKLGGRLFFRNPKGILLTEEGRMFYGYIEQAYNFIMKAENGFSQMQNLGSGEVRIGAGDTLCRHYLLPYLKEFHERWPDVRIHVTNGTSPETLKLLKKGEVDVGIVNLPLGADDDGKFDFIETITIRDCFIAGDKYGFLRGKKVSFGELVRYPLMLLEKGSGMRSFIEAFAKKRNIEIVPEIELGSIDLLVRFAAIGLGVSYVIRDFIANELEDEDIFEIRLKENIPPRSIGIASLKGIPVSAAANRFIKLISKGV